MATPVPTTQRGELSLSRSNDGTLLMRLAGPWELRGELPVAERCSTRARINATAAYCVRHRAAHRVGQRSAHLSHAGHGAVPGAPDSDRPRRFADRCAAAAGLGRGGAGTQPARGRRPSCRRGWRASARRSSMRANRRCDMLAFIGEITVALGKLVRGKARFRRSRSAAAHPASRCRCAGHHHADQLPGRHHPGVRRRRAAASSSAQRSTSPIWSASPWCARWAR